MTLSALQGALWRFVRTEPAASEVASFFEGTPAFPAEARLQVYRVAYWVRQVSVLRSLFPRIVARLGDGPFARTASRYVGACPSRHSAIEHLARDFPRWLGEEDVALGQLADCELASWEVLVAPDARSLPMQAARAEGFALARLRVGEHVRVVRAGPTVLAELAVTTRQEGAAALAVWRAAWEVQRAAVSEAEAEAIGAAKEGVSVEALCDRLARDGGDATFVFGVLSRWFARGWIVALSQGPP